MEFNDQEQLKQDDTTTINESSTTDEDSLHVKQSIAKRKSFIYRLLNKKPNNSTPELKKGSIKQNTLPTYVRKRDEEPDASFFPKKRKIISWQEEAMVFNNEQDSLELAEEMNNLAQEINAK